MALQEIYDVDVIVDFEELDSDVVSEVKKRMSGVEILNFPWDSKACLMDKIKRKLNLIFNPLTPEMLMPTNLSKYRKIHELIKTRNYKWIITRYLFMVSYHRLYNLDNLVVDIDDIPFKKLESTLQFTHGILTKKDSNIIQRYKSITYKTAKMAKILFLPDKNDCTLFPGSHYLPNIPITPKHIYTRNPEFRIMFVGSMTQDMNYSGVDHFLCHIWPNIIKKNPGLEFHIIGNGTPELFVNKWRNLIGVKLRGFVDDIDLEYSKSLAAVAPIYSGAGTNIKVLEAISHRCPIVTSNFAMRGFNDDFIHMRDVLIANNDSEFVKYVDLLIHNSQLNMEIANSGYSIISEKYSLVGFKNRLQIILNNYY